MNRRNFVQLAMAGSAVSLLSPAAHASSPAPSPAGSLYYTREAPGRWEAKVATHLPIVEVKQTADGVVVDVATSHEMKAYEHYIVKHALFDKDYKFLAEKMFNPAKDAAPLSSFNIGPYKGTLHVISMCNKHDVWLETVVI